MALEMPTLEVLEDVPSSILAVVVPTLDQEAKERKIAPFLHLILTANSHKNGRRTVLAHPRRLVAPASRPPTAEIMTVNLEPMEDPSDQALLILVKEWEDLEEIKDAEMEMASAVEKWLEEAVEEESKS